MTQMNFTDKIKVAIIANGKYQSKRLTAKLFAILRNDDRFYLTKKNPDIVITIGGDGMLLSFPISGTMASDGTARAS